MPSHDEHVERWLDVLEGTAERCYSSSSTNLYGDVGWSGRPPALYSYGSHFPLVEFLPAGASGRERPLFLCNGDRVSSTTSRHQSIAQSAVRRRAEGMGADVLIVPFSALGAARIDRRTIRPLEVRPDRWETLEHSAATLEDVPERERYRTEYRTAETLEDVPPEVSARGWADESWKASPPFHGYRPAATGRYHWRELIPLERAEDGRYHWTSQRHWLGDAVFLADVDGTRTLRRPCSLEDVIRAAVATVRNQTAAHGRDRRDRIRLERIGRSSGAIETLRDPLALLDVDAPIVETVPVRRRRRFVSSFDVNEPAPLYFLATLPSRSRARTVADGILDLAPPAVHAAMARGRDVRRQGDIFFIGADLADETVHAMSRERARLTQWTRGAAARPGEVGHVRPRPLGPRERAYRRERYATERASRTAAYLERGRPSTDAGARRKYARTLRRRTELRAEYASQLRAAVLWGDDSSARHVRRKLETLEDGAQRDLAELVSQRDRYRTAGFGIGNVPPAASAWSDACRIALERFRPERSAAGAQARRERLRDTLRVHGTAHTATEVARARGAGVYVRGIVRHVPELEGGGRERDHVNLRLGDGRQWYLAVRNTVPRDTGRP